MYTHVHEFCLILIDEQVPVFGGAGTNGKELL